VAVIEFARNVAGLAGANSTEFEPHAKHPVIGELPEQKRIEGLGGTMRLGGQEVEIRPGSLAEFLYRARIHSEPGPGGHGRPMVRERFRHRFEVEPEYIERLEAAGLVFSGRHPAQPIMQVLELPPPGEGAAGPTHPFFIAGQCHPELTSRPLHPQPLFMGLIAATIQRKYRLTERAQMDPTLARWTRGPRPGAVTV
jgi:CTP synthase